MKLKLSFQIWLTAKKQGKRAATYFWPGSDVKIQGWIYQVNPFPNKPGFYVSFENTVGKGEIAHDKQFLFFPVFSFLPIWRTFIFIKV